MNKKFHFRKTLYRGLRVVLTLIALLTTISVNAQNYDSMWAKVANFEQQSLPKSAAEEVNNILRQAIADKNSPQVIKALIHQRKYDLVVDSQNDTTIFRNLNDMLVRSSDAVEQSVLNSMLGELYLQYYQRDMWQINQRTALGDFIPEDMKEWTRNIFFDKAIVHFNASLQPQAQLENTQVDTYAAVIHLGSDSRRFFPTMYDFLARRAISFLAQISADEDLSRSLARKNITIESLFAPSDEFVNLSFQPELNDYNLWVWEVYRQYFSSLLKRRMDESVLLIELDKTEYLPRMFSDLHHRLACPMLETLLNKWESQPISVEIINRIANTENREIAGIADQETKKERIKNLYNFLQNTVQKFSHYERISLIENQIEQLTRPTLSVSGNATFPKNGKKELTISFRNLRSLNAKLFRADCVLAPATFVKNITIPLPSAPAYWQTETVFSLDINEFGTYRLTFETSPEMNPHGIADYLFTVSDLAVFLRGTDEDSADFFVVNRVTGAPIQNAQIEIFRSDWRNIRQINRENSDLIQTVSSNKQGLAVSNVRQNRRNSTYHFRAVWGNDTGARFSELPTGWFRSNSLEDNSPMVHFFTDRSIYRPGQTVYFKGVATKEHNKVHHLLPNRLIEVSLYNANGQNISQQTLTTNEFGSISGEFILPQNLLSGHFGISANNENSWASFRVEEYRRPTFEVTFEQIAETYTFGEEIVLRGKAEAFSGIKIQNATVDFRINRQQIWWRHWGWNSGGEQFVQGSVSTDENGGFEIRLTPEKPDARRTFRDIYLFSIEATITSASGETQIGTHNVTVGDVSMILNIEMPAQWDKESEQSITVSARNLSGSDIITSGTYQIFSLHDNDSINRQIAQGNFTTGEQNDVKTRLRRLNSGRYRITLQSTDDRGNSIEAVHNFTLFSFSDRRPPIQTNEWLVQRSTTFGANKNAEILFGVSDKTHVLYELWQAETILERKWLTLNNENRLFTFSHKPEYKNGITLRLTYVKDEQFYSHSIDMRPEQENRELNVRLDVFRDRIRPGTDEEWRISVIDKDGNPVSAEVLASMYDMSLDNIVPYAEWFFQLPNLNAYLSSQRGLQQDNSFFGQGFSGRFNGSSRPVHPFQFDSFYWFNFSFFRGERMLFSSRTRTVEEEALPESANVLEEVVVAGFATESRQMRSASVHAVPAVEMAYSADMAGGVSETAESKAILRQAERDTSTPQIRQSFAETAFFYPQLRTNERGETQIAFTVPESNTRWRFRVLAHDKNLNVGQAEAFTVSQKELMVTPNMPRFLRQGDRVSIATKVSNLSESAMNGKVRIELFNPVTEAIISTISIDNQTQTFSLAQNASTDASWTFDIPTDIDLIGVRIIAENESFSDGEQHALAILPNRMLVTESMRMDVNGTQTKSFEMSRLTQNASPTAENFRLTLEFASNPAWYAVQALPVLSTPDSENAISWFAAYYTNTLGVHIGSAYPKVRAMIEAWQQQGGTSETLLSNLETNQELKTVLLEETPWVLEAQNESEQKQRLALLFDLNRSRNLTSSAIQKLNELQAPEGGWSWFQGFRPSVSITHYIVYGFGQLADLQAVTFSDEVREMQARAIRFIDAEAVRRFEALKKSRNWQTINTLSTTDLEYLYVRSAYTDIPFDARVKELTDLYLSVIERNWIRFGLYERALIAVLMQRNGKSQIVDNILRSYREHATVSDELGMFWANNRAHVFISQSAVSVHTFIMNAFRAGNASETEMNNMKRWLLKQKQTQLWESTHATLDAIYALLSTGSDWFSTDGNTTITLGNQTVESAKTELGTGYFKESWHRTEIRPEMGNVTVNHTGNSPAWGALYLQYFEELDKIENINDSLDVEKMLFVENASISGKNLVRVTEENPLAVGDKVVVRLTVRTDRDLEFVHLRSMRAACFEPIEQLSGMRWQNGVMYYQTSRDASTNFYFDVLPRGTYVFEYSMFVNRTGSYSNGITTIQSMYAPEFTSHTSGIRIIVK